MLLLAAINGFFDGVDLIEAVIVARLITPLIVTLLRLLMALAVAIISSPATPVVPSPTARLGQHAGLIVRAHPQRLQEHQPLTPIEQLQPQLIEPKLRIVTDHHALLRFALQLRKLRPLLV